MPWVDRERREAAEGIGVDEAVQRTAAATWSSCGGSGGPTTQPVDRTCWQCADQVADYDRDLLARLD